MGKRGPVIQRLRKHIKDRNRLLIKTWLYYQLLKLFCLQVKTLLYFFDLYFLFEMCSKFRNFIQEQALMKLLKVIGIQNIYSLKGLIG